MEDGSMCTGMEACAWRWPPQNASCLSNLDIRCAGTRLPFIQYVVSLAILQAIQVQTGECIFLGLPHAAASVTYLAAQPDMVCNATEVQESTECGKEVETQTGLCQLKTSESIGNAQASC